MKKKLPIIAIIAALAVCIFIVTSELGDKKEKAKQYESLAASVSDEALPEAMGKTYEFIQTNPESGLAVIYTFEISETDDGTRIGRIIADSSAESYEIICAVLREEDAEVFIFGRYAEGELSGADFSAGDVLARLHFKEGRIIPEWVGLRDVTSGEVVANF